MSVQTVRATPANPARFSVLLARLFPPGVGSGELREDAEASLLYPEERWAARTFDADRLRAFTAGRLSARRALAGVGFARYPLGGDAEGGPRWPDSIVGCTTHTTGFYGAVAANRHHFDHIGIDAEIVGKVTTELWPEIFTPKELAMLGMRSTRKAAQTATLMFSAKAALLRCRADVVRGLSLREIEVGLSECEAAAGLFTISPARPDRETFTLHGNFRFEDMLVVTGIGIARRPAPTTLRAPRNT